MPPGPERCGYNGVPDSFTTYSQLFPNDDFAYVSPDNLDLEMVNRLDAIIYYLGVSDGRFLGFVDRLQCPVLAMLVGTNGYYDSLTHLAFGGINRTVEVLNKCDLVVGVDQWGMGIFPLYTKTPVVYMPIPMPIEYAQQVASESAVGEYDIVIPYGPYISQIRERNGILACLIAQRIIDEIPYYRNMAVFNLTNQQSDMDATEEFMRDLGCKDFVLFPYVSYGEFIKVLAGAKLGLDLDICRGTGKFAVDCAILRKPAILSSTLSYAVAIYRRTGALVHPLDVNAVMGKALFISQGLWPSSWRQTAYVAAQEYSISKAAERLEEAVKVLNATKGV